MSSKTLCGWLRAATIAVAVCFLILMGYVMPVLLKSEFSPGYYPWLIFLWICALPCFAVFTCVWKVSGEIMREKVFTLRTAQWVHTGAILLFADVGLFFAGNLIYIAIGLSRPGILMCSLLIDIFGISLALAAATLSRYLTKAATLQEESEGTI